MHPHKILSTKNKERPKEGDATKQLVEWCGTRTVLIRLRKSQTLFALGSAWIVCAIWSHREIQWREFVVVRLPIDAIAQLAELI